MAAMLTFILHQNDKSYNVLFNDIFIYLVVFSYSKNKYR